jgi:hypothetical protein
MAKVALLPTLLYTRQYTKSSEVTANVGYGHEKT